MENNLAVAPGKNPDLVRLIAAIIKLVVMFTLSGAVLFGQSVTGFPARWVAIAFALFASFAGIGLVVCEAAKYYLATHP